MTTSHPRALRALLGAMAALAVSAAAPAGASAVTVQVTGDSGAPIAIRGTVSIRYLNPDVSVVLEAGEHFGYTVTAPSGAAASVPNSCADSGETRQVNYFGNGAYTVRLVQYAATDATCSGAPVAQSSVSFTINASVAVASPPKPALTRNPGSSIVNRVSLPVSLNPGGISNQLFYGHNSALAPDGSLATAAGQLFPDTQAGTVDVPLDKGPGTYQVVGRAQGFNIAGDVFTAWSAPAVIRAFVPFDLRSLRFPDARGPSYRLRARINAAAATGRVTVLAARGRRGGRFRSLGSARIRRHVVVKRFTLARTGVYRIRLRYRGNALVAPGFEQHRIRIARRVTFRTAAVIG